MVRHGNAGWWGEAWSLGVGLLSLMTMRVAGEEVAHAFSQVVGHQWLMVV